MNGAGQAGITLYMGSGTDLVDVQGSDVQVQHTALHRGHLSLRHTLLNQCLHSRNIALDIP